MIQRVTIKTTGKKGDERESAYGTLPYCFKSPHAQRQKKKKKQITERI